VVVEDMLGEKMFAGKTADAKTVDCGPPVPQSSTQENLRRYSTRCAAGGCLYACKDYGIAMSLWSSYARNEVRQRSPWVVNLTRSTRSRRNRESLMRYAAKWIAMGLLLAAPVLLAQNSGPNQAPPNQVPQNSGPQNQGPQNQVPANQAPPNQAPQTAAPPAAPGASPPASAATAQPKTHKVLKELVLPPLPSGPLPQMPMDQIPATPAKVTFLNGLLTISAENSTLSEILRDVRKLTGAVIDIPSGSGANERVVAHLGPGAPRDVLAVLLNGSSFNYVMIGSSTDRNAVSSVILTSKGGDSQPQTASNGFESSPSPSGPPMGGPMPPNRFAQPMANMGQRPGRVENPPADDSNDDAAADEQETADDTAEDQAQPTPAQPVPDPAANPATAVNANPNANAQDPQQPDANQPNAGPKTPEQILEMLRRQQPPGAITPPQPPPQQ